MEWVLVIAFLSPGGDFMGKQGIVLPNRASCQRAVVALAQRQEPMPMQLRGVCVTRAHWEGKAQDKGMAFD